MRKLLYILLFTVLPALPKSASAQMDSLLNALKTAKEDTNKVNLLNELSEQCDEKDIVLYAQQCYDLAEKLSYRKAMADALNNMGYAYDHFGDITRSLDCYTRSLKIYESIGDKNGIASVLNNIGYTYEEQNDFANAKEYYKKSLTLHREMKDTLSTGNVLNNIGVVFIKEHKADSALDYYMQSLKISKLTSNYASIATLLTNIGYIYLEKGDTVTALNDFMEDVRISKQIGNKRGLTSTYVTLGTLYYYKGDYKQALEYCKQSLAIAQELGLPKNIEDASHQLSATYAKMKNFEGAYEMNLLSQKMHDSIYNVAIRESTVKSKMQYEFEKKEAAAKAEQDKKDATQAIIRNSFIGGFVLVLVLALVILRGYRNKQKANVEISIQKEIIEKKNKEVTDSIQYAQRIQQSLLPTEKYIDRNLQRLKKK